MAETLAMRGVRVVVLDVRKGEWEGEVGGEYSSSMLGSEERKGRRDDATQARLELIGVVVSLCLLSAQHFLVPMRRFQEG